MHENGEESIAITTTEVLERRHLVQPYGRSPVVELRQGVVACPYCGNESFRRSRLRFKDVLELLMFRWPTRCTRCGQRQYLGFVVAFLAFPPKVAAVRVSKGQESWQNWTSADAPVQVARPLSTAMEPKARNLAAIPQAQQAEPAPVARPQPAPDTTIW